MITSKSSVVFETQYSPAVSFRCSIVMFAGKIFIVFKLSEFYFFKFVDIL